jgi:tRNA pseudouridine55 synthase
MLNGLLTLDKPAGITSREAVDRIARFFPRSTRIGHTGTLDPLATGVLVLCIGSATRFTEYVQAMAKTYRTTLVLGARSDTDDAEGPIVPVAGATAPARARVAGATQSFVGDIDQVPPAFSAAKLGGRRAYALARQGREVVLQPRRVHIAAIDILDYGFPRLTLEIQCGKGTYIRSLARDLGAQLGCGAYVEALRRTRVGPFTTDNALSMEMDAAAIRGHMQPAATAVSELPRVTVPTDEVSALRNGRSISAIGTGVGDNVEPGAAIAVFDLEGALVAVAKIDRKNKMLKPEKVVTETHQRRRH